MLLYFYFWMTKPDFNCCNSFALSWIDKVATGTQVFVPVIVNVGYWPTVGSSVMKHLAGQVRIRLNSQSINSISRVLQKLLKCFNGTLVLTFFIPSFSILLVVFILNLKKHYYYYQQENQQYHHFYLKMGHLYSIVIKFQMF